MESDQKYYLLAGEASGDLHAANLVRSIRQLTSATRFRCWGGGEKLQKVGVPIAKHYRELAFMGFIEVVQNLKSILRNFKACKADILDFKPNVLILIDYPGFNLRMAEWAHKQGLKVIYYIAPQLWAWKKNRIKVFKKYIDHLLVILPFERSFFLKEGYQQVTYVGHPLLDHIREFQISTGFRSKYDLGTEPIIALLPGSRKQEIKTMLPVFMEVSRNFPEYQFVIAGAPGQALPFYQEVLSPFPEKPPVVFDQTYQLLAQAEAALVTSGTATLETALFNVPQVVCYKGNVVSYQIAKRLVQVPYISLVNLIANAVVVEELIQADFHPARVREALDRILQPAIRDKIKTQYELIKQQLGDGTASLRAAQKILELIDS